MFVCKLSVYVSILILPIHQPFYRRTNNPGAVRVPQQNVHGASERDAVARALAHGTSGEDPLQGDAYDLLQEEGRLLGSG